MSLITAYEVVFVLFVTVNWIVKSLFNHTIRYISVSLALFHSSIHCHPTDAISALCLWQMYFWIAPYSVFGF